MHVDEVPGNIYQALLEKGRELHRNVRAASCAREPGAHHCLSARDAPHSSKHRHVRGVQPPEHLLLKQQAKVLDKSEQRGPSSRDKH